MTRIETFRDIYACVLRAAPAVASSARASGSRSVNRVPWPTTLSQVIEAATGARPEFSTAGGTSDARFVAQYCPVVELGLPGPTMHKADECVPLADVRALTALYAAFLTRYFGGAR